MIPWASEADLECAPSDPTSVLTAATEVLWVRSGRQFGLRNVTVRPCVPAADCRNLSSWGAAASVHHGWCLGGSPSTTCSCNLGASAIRLGVGPLVDVQRVMVDGVEVLNADREVQEQEWLVYLADTNGQPRYWPTTQRLDLADTEVGTFSVTATVGVAVPELGRLATLELACKLDELADDSCAPDNARGMVKDGVSYELISVAEALVNAHEIPLPLTMAFIDTYNPKRMQRRSRVLFPPPPSSRRVDSVGS